jgi:hypothetical protein
MPVAGTIAFERPGCLRVPLIPPPPIGQTPFLTRITSLRRGKCDAATPRITGAKPCLLSFRGAEAR